MKYSWMALIIVVVLAISVPVLGETGELLNSGFEDFPEGVEPGEDGVPYGWTLFGPLTDSQEIVITDEVVRTGSFALKLDDGDTAKSLGIRSAYLPVKGGEICVATVYTFIPKEGGVSAAMLYLEFWDGDKNVRVEHAAVTEGIKGEWAEMTAILPAPANARYVNMLLYISVPAQGIAYFDDAKIEIF